MSAQPDIPLEHPEIQVLIVGCGIGGLALANLLEKSNTPYLILEKASSFKPLGSAICLTHATFRFLDQLGIYADLLAVGKPFKNLHVQTLDVKKNGLQYKGVYDTKLDMEQAWGYDQLMLARPDLMEALLKPIPKSKILMKKKVIEIHQNEAGVTVKTEDGSEYSGDILVGADGCYSNVREAMFKAILARGETLPPSDTAPLDYNIDCIVGVTEPMDPRLFPGLHDPKCEFQVVLPTQPTSSIWYMPLSRGRMGWMINECMTKERKAEIGPIYGSGNNNVKASDWDGDAAMEMCKRFGDYKTPYGVNLSTFVDATPPELISKVMLEEKYFETWTDGRVCLIGDACHKVLPFGAVGATNAMQDALQLANLLYDLKSNSHQDICALLTRFHSMRAEYGRDAVNGSSSASKLFHKKGFLGDFSRFSVLKLFPDWLVRLLVTKLGTYRPLCIFLDSDQVKPGNKKPFVQSKAVRYMMEQAKKTKEIDTVESSSSLSAVKGKEVGKHDVEEQGLSLV